jgi:hypothetical protein
MHDSIHFDKNEIVNVNDYRIRYFNYYYYYYDSEWDIYISIALIQDFLVIYFTFKLKFSYLKEPKINIILPCKDFLNLNIFVFIHYKAI